MESLSNGQLIPVSPCSRSAGYLFLLHGQVEWRVAAGTDLLRTYSKFTTPRESPACQRRAEVCAFQRLMSNLANMLSTHRSLAIKFSSSCVSERPHPIIMYVRSMSCCIALQLVDSNKIRRHWSYPECATLQFLFVRHIDSTASTYIVLRWYAAGSPHIIGVSFFVGH